MGCTFPNLDLSIFKDKIIIIALVLIVILSGVLIHMIQSSSPPEPKILPGHGHNHTKIITTWTLVSGEDYNNCMEYGSVFGGSGINSSTKGACYKCNCTMVVTKDE